MAFRSILKRVGTWYYEEAGWCKYGLLRDDLLPENPAVQETLRRLPPHVLAARDMRFKRAFDLDLKKLILPREQWTKIQDDLPYLEPTLSEVNNEMKQRKLFHA